MTAHRRESFGAPLANICGALAEVAGEYSHAFHFLWVLHPNPNVYYPVSELLYGMPGISLIDPLDYVTFVSLVNRATLILTDSGGILEEAASLGKPVLIMRDYTERTEAIEAGLAKLVGTDKQRLIAAVRESLNNETLFQEKTLPNQIYGDGRASERIVQALVARFG